MTAPAQRGWCGNGRHPATRHDRTPGCVAWQPDNPTAYQIILDEDGVRWVIEALKLADTHSYSSAMTVSVRALRAKIEELLA